LFNVTQKQGETTDVEVLIAGGGGGGAGLTASMLLSTLGWSSSGRIGS
jgi:hypothetical protein